ncbi:MAG: aspartate 1-decarboxylase [Candidatus Alcyoniella australis]|nr:aspartate 1-decarboxylase [Candidatus Alcyoniella australis]
MKRTMLKSKIHRCVVTGADVHYEGSIAIDSELMAKADILPYEKLDIWNVDAGTRFSTYAIVGKPGSGEITVNGAAARLVAAGDKVIIASWLDLEPDEIAAHKPKLLFVDEHNRVKSSAPKLAIS